MPETARHAANDTTPLIEAVVGKYSDDLVLMRRDLHAHPELSWAEARTTGMVAQRLSQAGLRGWVREGRRLLVTELCGSAWYYGVSGCSMAGYAPVDGKDPGEPEGWRPVYESEGVFLYVDPDIVSDGWPGLIAIPAKGDGETRWRWNGKRYSIVDPGMAGDAAAETQGDSN
jgi:hypothetical protein